MADKLADFVVGIGLKGQNVALKEINKAKKAGKELSKQRIQTDVQSRRSETNARKQIDLIKRQTQATKTQTEVAKKQTQAQSQFTQNLRGGVQSGVGVASSAMTGGVSSVASQTPLLGSFFGASQSAIESAAQEYVAGVTAAKNIQLVKSNYARAFGGAFSEGMQRTIDAGMFSDRAAKAFYSSLTDQGVAAGTSAKLAPGLDVLARSQGVGNIEELMGRLQSGTLKEQAGLTKSDIVLLQSQAQLLNNRFTSDIGAQMITQTLQRVMPQMSAVAGTQNMRRLSQSVRAEGNIQESEQNYSEGATSLFGGSYEAMNRGRTQDRALRARLQGAARRVNNVGRNIADRATRLVENVSEYGLVEGYRRTINQTVDDMREGRGITDDTAASGGTIQTGDSEADDAPANPAPLSMQADTINNEILRSGRAIADSLTQINNQLNATRAQMRRV